MSRAAIAASDAVAINAVLVAARQPIDIVCDRWSLSLVVAALLGETRFGGLMDRTAMASRLITARLRALEKSGIFLRVPISVRPPRHEYRLTNMGADLFQVIIQMVRWEQNWNASARHGGIDPVHQPCGADLHPQLRCRGCGELATARDIALKVSQAQLRDMPDKQTAHRRSTIDSGRPGGATAPLGASLDIFGDKWGIEVLLCAFFRVRRFSDFRACIGISTNILADRLARLVAAGILHRAADGARQPGYRLTEMGVDIYGVLVAMQDWADFWIRERYRSPVRLIHRDCGKVFHPLTTCAHCRRGLERSQVALRPSGS